MTTKALLTVVIVGSGDQEAIQSSLHSLSNQSVALERVNVFLAIVGSAAKQVFPLDLDDFDMEMDVAYIEDVSDSSQQTAILQRLTGEYITFVNEGDQCSHSFLEILLQYSAMSLVPVSQIARTESNAAAAWNSHYNRAVLRHEARAPQLQVGDGAIMTEIAGKSIHRSGLSGETLAYALRGQSLLFNVNLALTYEFEFCRFPAGLGATYYRASATKGETLDNNLVDREELFDVVEKLQEIKTKEISARQLVLVKASLMWQLQSRDLHVSSSQRETILQKISEIGLVDTSREILDESVSTLAIVANFAPYAGTAGIVAAKRIIESGKKVDVISSTLSSRKRQDGDLKLTEDRVRVHEVISATPTSIIDHEISEFIEKGLRKVERLQMQGARYSDLYSRAMVPHSHFLAAAIKRRHPEMEWIAEFSDPLSLTVKATPRTASFSTSLVTDKFAGWGSFKQQMSLLEENSMPKWAELLAYFFADRLIFTNQHQLETMLDYAPAYFRRHIESKAVIARHPTLPAHYYKMGTPRARHTGDVITLAYFGDFHSTRGMGEVLEGLNRLSDEIRRQFRLVIFSDSKKRYIHGKLPQGLSQIVEVQPRLNYLDFLATLNEMSILIVNDSLSREYFKLNPYLPSKVSDYLGSQRPIWAIYEAGSVLSEMEFAFKSELGDAYGAEAVLRQIYETKTIV